MSCLNINNANEIDDIGDMCDADIDKLISGFDFNNDNDEYYDNNENDIDICPRCNTSENIIEEYARGIKVCSCGQVVGEIDDTNLEKKQYDDEKGDIARCGTIHNRLLPQSSLGTNVACRGRLKKLQIWNSMPYKERSLNAVFKEVKEVCSKNGIVKKIEDDSKIMYKHVSERVHKIGKNKGKPIITRGFNRRGIIAASLFIACRKNNETRSTKEIASYFHIEEKDVNKGIRGFLDLLKTDSYNIDTGTSKVGDFVNRKCNELNIKSKYTKIAVTIAENIDRLNIASDHTTYSLAAASILLMANINKLNSITKKRLSEIFEVSDVTIGKTYQQIESKRDILVNNIKVDQIMTEIKNENEKKIIPLAVWDKMIKFGVDISKYKVIQNTNTNPDEKIDTTQNEKIDINPDKKIDSYNNKLINVNNLIESLKSPNSIKNKIEDIQSLNTTINDLESELKLNLDINL